MSDKKQEIIEIIKQMSVLELSELVSEMEEIFGVSAAAPVAVAAQGVAVEDEKEEQTEFDLVLTGIGDKKIQVIKVVRAITKLGLKEAKELVDTFPKPVVEGVSKEDAEKYLKQIQDTGATAEIK